MEEAEVVVVWALEPVVAAQAEAAVAQEQAPEVVELALARDSQ